MSRQSQLPHTAPPPGPCDVELERWLDAREETTDAAAEKKRRYSELLDAMIEAGVSRIPYVDPATNRRKWLCVRSEAKLVSAKAEAQEETGDTAPKPKRTRTAALATVGPPEESDEQRASADPFGDTKADMAVDGDTLAQDESEDSDPTGGQATGNDATGQENSESTSDLRTAAQQRKRGAR